MEEAKVELREEIGKMNVKTHELEAWYRIWATSKGGTYFHIEVHEKDLPKASQVIAERARELDAIK